MAAVLVSAYAIELHALEIRSDDGLRPYFDVRLWAGYSSSSGASARQTGDSFTNEYRQDLPVSGSANMGLRGDVNNLRGRAEIGMAPESQERDDYHTGGGGIYLRHLFVQYAMGPVGILFGQTWTPYTYLASKNIADDEESYRDVGTYDGRLPQVRIGLNRFMYAAFISPNREDLSWRTIGAEIAPSSIPGNHLRFEYPKIAAGMNFSTGPVLFNIHGVYQTFHIEKGEGSSNPSLNSALNGLDGKSIRAFMIPASIHMSFALISINFNGYWGKNTGALGVRSSIDTNPRIYGSSIQDKTSLGWRMDYSIHALICIINFGYSHEAAGAGVDFFTGISDSYYVNVMIYPEKNFYIAPAWWRESIKSEGKNNKFGLKFQANF